MNRAIAEIIKEYKKHLETLQRIKQNDEKFMESITKKSKDIIELEKIWNAGTDDQEMEGS